MFTGIIAATGEVIAFVQAEAGTARLTVAGPRELVATPAGSPLGGHVVQGHVDGMGILMALEPVRVGGESDWKLRVRLPSALMRYVVEKGSITIEGISLTVAGLSDGAEGDEIWIAILPHTYSATNLHALRPGDGVNIEVDVLAKYAEGRARGELSERELTIEYLLANGY